MYRLRVSKDVFNCDRFTADSDITTNSHAALSHSCLGAFAELQKATISFVMSVCPSAWNNSAPTGRSLMKFDI